MRLSDFLLRSTLITNAGTSMKPPASRSCVVPQHIGGGYELTSIARHAEHTSRTRTRMSRVRAILTACSSRLCWLLAPVHCGDSKGREMTTKCARRAQRVAE